MAPAWLRCVEMRHHFHAPAAHLVAALCLGPLTRIAQAAVVAPTLERAMAARGTHADTAVILRFTESLDLQPFAVNDRRERDNRLLLALKARAARNRAAVEPLLMAHDAQRIRDLWIINGLAATVPAVAVKELARHPGIERIELDSFVQHARSQRTPPPRTPPHRERDPAPAAAAPPPELPAVQTTRATPGWNIVAVQAPELWAVGQTGKGVVIATMDTGVDFQHPDLSRKWRGGTNSWFDPHGEEAAPYDALGHGTQAMSVILGGSALGVAPDARWISVRMFNSAGRASMSDIHLAFQWLMDPDGDAATLDAPDIVNGGANGSIVSPNRDKKAARRFFTRALAGATAPAEVTTDRAAAYPRVLDELLPAAQHVTVRYANNRVEADHGRLKARLRPMRGLKRDRSLRIVATGHAFVQNLRRGHYELATEAADPRSRGGRVHRTRPRHLIDPARQPLPPAPPPHNATAPLEVAAAASRPAAISDGSRDGRFAERSSARRGGIRA